MRDSYGRATLMHLPCGKCCECLASRQNSWKLRLLEESSNWKYLYFFTLTYSDESLPLSDSGFSQVDKRHIQAWLKRFRTRYSRAVGVDAEFKYFIASEYAPDGYYTDRHGNYRRSTMRPHYHGLIFTDIPESIIRGTLLHDWRMNFGYFKLDRVEFGREHSSSVANYVSKYCCKGCFASRADEIERGEINPTFNLMSKGIGSSYVDKNAEYHRCGSSLFLPVDNDTLSKIIARRFVRDGSFKYRMPRYYADRIYKLPVYTFRDRFDRKTLTVKENVKIKIFDAKTPLSQQIASVLQFRFAQKLSESFDAFRNFCPGATPCEVDFFGDSPEIMSFREGRARDKLASFYKSSALRNSSLCFSNI